MKESETAAGPLREVGALLFDGADDWQSRMAPVMGVRKATLQHWQSGAVPLPPDHGALRDLLASRSGGRRRRHGRRPCSGSGSRESRTSEAPEGCLGPHRRAALRARPPPVSLALAMGPV
jgi:hypothetical protein